MQYLILHKVRGEPSFDVAEKTTIGDEEGWILSTCGHRAYPYWYTPFSGWVVELPDENDRNPPSNWPDHYQQPVEKKMRISMRMFDKFSKMTRRL
jgi:hypothetical protein